jgi:Ser/Thr protein kinase RdoA (MazF antagonist)
MNSRANRPVGAAGPIMGNDVLTSVDSSPSTDEIAAFVLRHYGLVVEVVKLSAERDDNYRITTADGSQFLFKIAHSAEDPMVVDLQTKAFQHVGAAMPSRWVQRVLPTIRGELRTSLTAADGRQRLAWMLTYLPGVPLSSCSPTREHAAQLGLIAAELDTALHAFDHPAPARGLLWDMQHAVKTRALLQYTDAASDRLLGEQAIDTFERETAPLLASLRTQVIHNDLNPYNVIVHPVDPHRITGIIDFGDMVRAPLVNEVAVAAAYLVSATDAPFGTVPNFVAAYHSRNPLMPAEIAVLPQLIAVRQAIAIAITNWRAAMYPENREYILRNHDRALWGLRKLMALGERPAREQLSESVQ